MEPRTELFPPIPLEEWEGTKQTLHRFLQIIGKVRLEHSVRRNHWWHVPYHLTGQGITTRPMGLEDGNPIFTVDFDFVRHRVVANTLEGAEGSFPLTGHTVGTFYSEVMDLLGGLGVKPSINHPYPFDLPDADRPFEQDNEHHTYVPQHANRYWRVLSQVAMVLERFAADYSGKVSPVHHFWHTFDIAMTRFHDMHISQPRDAGSVIREAYSRDVVSFGFWFGDDTIPEPTFYSYTAPEPEGLTNAPLPPGARWMASGHGHLAVLPYNTAREAANPRAAVLDFYQAAYTAGANLLGWNQAALACPYGVTDPFAVPSRR
ncbi:hypothetical protein J4H86_22920 [Spiractinospora alimapuensis]|uniref:DUF5996 family protein n=1 Tax=Spiractinospora alimapuensis TaxID=2820884 RepID=UPI001F3A007C|nr:DUF5996 family protein [Spiractinospora alimapuensis]QVQ51604.1 hypothetical protein J4H86_22920 [Spiractinospora alimapuensis]